MTANSKGSNQAQFDLFVSLRRFFTTVAINQLAKKGFLNISDPVRSRPHEPCMYSSTKPAC